MLSLNSLSRGSFPRSPREADHIDTIYMVGIREVASRNMPILVVIWTRLQDGFHVETAPIEVPRILQCEWLLSLVGVDVICEHPAVECEISHNLQPCARQRWYVQEGMKFTIDIMPASQQVNEQESHCDAPHDVTSFVQQGALCHHARQNVFAHALTYSRPLLRDWSYEVWWHDNLRWATMRRTAKMLHKRAGDCMICQVEQAFRHQLGGGRLSLHAVRSHDPELASWYVASPAEDMCTAFLVDLPMRRIFGTVLLCPFWEWFDTLDLPPASVLQLHKVDRDTPNNLCSQQVEVVEEVNMIDSAVVGSAEEEDGSSDDDPDEFSSMQHSFRWHIDNGRSSQSMT